MDHVNEHSTVSLGIPQSSHTVSVDLIDPGTRIDIPAEQFVRPSIPGCSRLKGPSFSFLISHPTGPKLLFDLSIRHDYENLAPIVTRAIHNPQHDWDLSVPKDVSDVLRESGTRLKEVDAIIWSHTHFDHLGNPALFPPSTKLVVGPGVPAALGSGYPSTADSAALAADWEGRDLVELEFSESDQALQIGQFNSLDWFGDGSFYLLDTPGHAVGHMCGLARVQEDSFILMAGDCAHHAGEFRPSKLTPIPDTLELCHNPSHPATVERTDPFYRPAENYTHDYAQCLQTLEGIAQFDASDDVLVVLAHDHPLLSVLEGTGHESVGGLRQQRCLDSWERNGLKQKSRWQFLLDFGRMDSWTL